MEAKEYLKAIKEIKNISQLQKLILKDICYWHYEREGYHYIENYVFKRYLKYFIEFLNIEITIEDLRNDMNNLFERDLIIRCDKQKLIAGNKFITVVNIIPNL